MEKRGIVLLGNQWSPYFDNRVVIYYWLSSFSFLKKLLVYNVSIFLFIHKYLKYFGICINYCNLDSNVIYSGFRYMVRNYILRQDNQFSLQVNI